MDAAQELPATHHKVRDGVGLADFNEKPCQVIGGAGQSHGASDECWLSYIALRRAPTELRHRVALLVAARADLRIVSHRQCEVATVNPLNNETKMRWRPFNSSENREEPTSR